MEEQQKKELINVRESRDGDFGIAPVRMVGNLGGEPDASYTSKGQAVTRFSLAVWNGKNNDTRWFKCTVWDDLAEEAREKLHKGTRVEVVGRLSFHLWQGTDRYEINVSWIQILQKPPVVQTIVESQETIEADKAWQVTHNVEQTPF